MKIPSTKPTVPGQLEYDLFVNVTEEEVRNVSIKFSDNFDNLWIPAGAFSMDKITRNSAVTLAKYEKLKKNPDLPRKHRKKGFIISAIFISCTIPEIVFFQSGYFTFIFTVLGFIIWGMTTQYYRKLCVDLIKISIALEKNWFYDPKPDYDTWKDLDRTYPEVFNRGNKNRNVEDQFWGNFTVHDRKYDFYSGIFNYTRERKDSKGNKSSTSYSKNFFCIKLPKKLKTRFFLFTNGTGVTSSEVKSKRVNTESIEFNRYFNLSYDADEEKILEIVKTLSPALQVRLMDMVKERGPYGILFTEDCIFFVFNGSFFRQFKTNLYKGIEMDPRDKEYYENQFSNLIKLTIDMIKYID